jgi:hypothetical protein
MWRNLIVCLALVLGLASTSYGDINVGSADNWAGWDEPWNLWYSEHLIPQVTLTPQGDILLVSGVSLGDASYLGTRGFDTDGVTPLYNYDTGYPNCWWFARLHPAASTQAALVFDHGVFGTSKFVCDIAGVPEGATIRALVIYAGPGVTYAETDMSLSPGHIVVDYINDLTHDSTYVDEFWSDAGSWTWDGLHLYDAVDVTTWSPSWYQVCLALDSPGLTGTATLYVDNARFVPEPASALIMALGATIISLRRRKC